MDPQFQELASEVADAVEKRLAGAFEERIAAKVEQRLSGAFEERIKTHIDDLEERVATRVEERLSGSFEERIKTHIGNLEERVATRVGERLSGSFEERIKTHINEFERRADLRMQMHFENLETNVKLAADGYGATLQKIERELVDLNKKVENGLRDHALVLTAHSKSIANFEERG